MGAGLKTVALVFTLAEHTDYLSILTTASVHGFFYFSQPAAAACMTCKIALFILYQQHNTAKALQIHRPLVRALTTDTVTRPALLPPKTTWAQVFLCCS